MCTAMAVVHEIDVSKAENMFGTVGATTGWYSAFDGNNEWETLLLGISQDRFHVLLMNRSLIFGDDRVQDIIVVDGSNAPDILHLCRP